MTKAKPKNQYGCLWIVSGRLKSSLKKMRLKNSNHSKNNLKDVFQWKRKRNSLREYDVMFTDDKGNWPHITLGQVILSLHDTVSCLLNKWKVLDTKFPSNLILFPMFIKKNDHQAWKEGIYQRDFCIIIAQWENVGWINKWKSYHKSSKNQACHIDFLSADVLRGKFINIKVLDLGDVCMNPLKIYF